MEFAKFLWVFYFLPLIFGHLNNKIENQFSTYETIKPKVFQQEYQRVQRSTEKEINQSSLPFITFMIHLNGQHIYIDLKRRDDLLSKNYSLQLQSSNAISGYTSSYIKEYAKDVKSCHYQGSIRHKAKSKVILSTCNGGFDGIIFDGDEIYFIDPGDAQNLQEKHLIFRQPDLLHPSNNSCGVNKTKSGIVQHKKFNHISKQKRAINTNNQLLIEPYNANKRSSYVEFLIVIDNAMYNTYEKNVEKIYQYCKDLTNIINAIYSQLNIFIVLINVIIWSEGDEINITTNPRETLDEFLKYRKIKLLKEFPHDHAQLLTTKRFEEGIVGKAYLEGICSVKSSGAVCVDHSPIKAVVALTMAHEMGHNFGLPHDEMIADCKCPVKSCIMSETSSSFVAMAWSSCSLDYIIVALSIRMNYCMQNKPKQTFDISNCGNGFVEPGEQCDCGLPEFCTNTCCDPQTCQLRSNATCAAGKCCDLKSCSIKPAGIMCRASNGECDLPEFCTGVTEFCPLDVFKRDLELCDENLAYCYQGKCQSHRLQCQTLWGVTGENLPRDCYARNILGDRSGNCGYDRLTEAYKHCEPGNELCGMLFCRHLTENPEIGSLYTTRTSTSYAFYNSTLSLICHSASIDFGLQSTDPGLTPNGAKCGENKMCLDQKCISIENLFAEGFGKLCPNNCSGNGVCNSRGNCHCDIGFGGDMCRLPGAGGSIDSGPITNARPLNTFQRFMIIFFCAAIPFAIMFMLLLWLFHQFFTNHRSYFNKKSIIDGLHDPSFQINASNNFVAQIIDENSASNLCTEDSQTISKSEENIINSKNSIDRSKSTEHIIKVIDLAQNKTATTLKTMPKTLNLSNREINKYLNKSNLALNKRDADFMIPLKSASCDEFDEQSQHRRPLETTNFKRHSNSCENL